MAKKRSRGHPNLNPYSNPYKLSHQLTFFKKFQLNWRAENLGAREKILCAREMDKNLDSNRSLK